MHQQRTARPINFIETHSSAASIGVFIGLAIGLSWCLWAPLTASALGWTDRQFSPYLHLLGGLGPAAAALIMSGREGRAKSFVLRAFRVNGQGVWIALAVVAPVAIYGLSALCLAALGYRFEWRSVGQSTEFPDLGMGAYVVANVLAYGFGEELGWRGYALPKLQGRATAFRATAVLAGVWAVWHLPLFAFADGMKAMGPAAVVGWLASIFAGAMLMTFVFNVSGGSVIALALFHGTLDVLINSPTEGPLQMVMGALVTICGLVVPFVFGTRNLAPRERVRE